VCLVVSPRHEKVARQELTFASSISGKTGGLSERESPPLSGPLLCENTAGGARVGHVGGRDGRGHGREGRAEAGAGALTGACGGGFGPGGRHGREKGE
jgi:hypothetical protein